MTEPSRSDPGPPVAGDHQQSRWSGRRIGALVVGAVLALSSLPVLAGGALALWVDRTQRNDAGLVVAGSGTMATSGYAVTSDEIALSGPDWVYGDRIFGEVRVTATPADPSAEVFLGIAETEAVERYLAGVAHTYARDLGGDTTESAGSAVPETPVGQDFWVTRANGPGEQAARWNVRTGTWTLVVMNADASRDVDVRVETGAELPVLRSIAVWLLVSAAVLLALATGLVLAATVRGRR